MAAFAKDARATDCQSGKPQMHWPKEGLRNTFVILYSWFIETKSSNCNWEDITVKDMRDVSITTQHENALSIVYNALYLSCTLGVDFPKPKGLDLNSEVPRNGGDLCHPYDKARQDIWGLLVIEQHLTLCLKSLYAPTEWTFLIPKSHVILTPSCNDWSGS